MNQLIDRKGPVNIICTLMKYEETFKIATHGLKTSLTEDKYEILGDRSLFMPGGGLEEIKGRALNFFSSDEGGGFEKKLSVWGGGGFEN